MYVTNGQFLGLTQAEGETDTAMRVNVYYNAFTSSGLTMPMTNQSTLSDGTNEVEILSEPASGTTYQPTYISIYNQDVVDHVTRVWLDISGSQYTMCNILIPSGDTLEWSREFGWRLSIGLGTQSYALSEFTSSGTWTKPAGLKRIMVLAVGAGGGAGSGRQGAAGENRFGGGGGGGGGCSWRMIDADSLTSTITVTIGTGGTGGAAQASTSSNGNAGTAGGDTSFGSLVIAKGGNAGGGGSTAAGTAGTGGQSSACSPAYSPFALSGGNGTAGNTITNAAGGVGFLSTGAPGGGGGGGINSSNTSGTAANSGGGIYENGVVQAGPTSGASPNGVNDVCTALFINNSISTTYGIGTAGAGNNPATPNGGNGGRCAGGGGGSGTLNGTSSGKGGDGGNGYLCVVEMY